MHEGCVVSMKASKFIKDIDVDIYNFLNEELAQYEDLPEYFYGKDFMPSVGDLKPLSDEQITYLLECYNEAASDAIGNEDDELYHKLQDRYLATKKIVEEGKYREIQAYK